MATTYKTPGVYIEEIPKLPPSVAQVETAIPAFVGYTAKAEKQGESLAFKPTKIRSMLEYRQYFGEDRIPESITATLDPDNNFSVSSVAIANTERYFLYDCMRLFFDNGGGQCYIVSVGTFGEAPIAGDEAAGTGLRSGVKALEKVDAPTMILFPDACNMVVGGEDDPAFYSLQQMALAQCEKLQDRVAVLDLKENIDDDHGTAVINFRQQIGINHLKYGAAYTPWVYATYPRDVDFATVVLTGLPAGITAETLTSDTALNALVSNFNLTNGELAAVEAVSEAIRSATTSSGNLPGTGAERNIAEKYKAMKQAVDAANTPAASRTTFTALMNFCRLSLLRFNELVTTLVTDAMKNDLNTYATAVSQWRGAAEALILLDRNIAVAELTGNDHTNAAVVNGLYPTINATWLGVANPMAVANPSAKNYGDSTVEANLPIIAKIAALDVQAAFKKIEAFANSLQSSATTYKKVAQDALYESHPIISNVVKHIKKEFSKLPPSGAIAGVYARVDNARGVWKAPANESLASVLAPAVNISHDEQSDLNVDVVAGKSINVIRSFTGKGTLVWGARTLAGNDNEWRYVSVRRFFNMVEESTKKATEPFVFEPNDANTWVKVQGMIENFLTLLWRQGALQGAKPEHAFYVAIGLNKTMTAIDILEGRMIVEIGMAVVRPAEFIILQFSHKMAES